MSEEMEVPFRELHDVADRVERLHQNNVNVTLPRFQRLESLIQTMGHTLPSMQDHALLYIRTMRGRYLDYIDRYHEELVQWTHTTADEFAVLHEDVTEGLGEISDAESR